MKNENARNTKEQIRFVQIPMLIDSIVLFSRKNIANKKAAVLASETRYPKIRVILNGMINKMIVITIA